MNSHSLEIQNSKKTNLLFLWKASMFYFSFLLMFCSCVTAQKTVVPSNYKLVFEENFSKPAAIQSFEMTDPSAWRMGSKGTLELYGKSNYKARVRSPFNIALIKDLLLGDFILEVSLAQSGREYGHRDLCLFFNVKDPTNFYYVHMATKADDHANNIFLVNDEPRVKIASKTSNGTDWGETNSWHKARIERNATEGTIKVFFDDMTTPIMEATDTHFDYGRIGFGSFDDTGQFDNIKIWAPSVLQKKTGFFK